MNYRLLLSALILLLPLFSWAQLTTSQNYVSTTTILQAGVIAESSIANLDPYANTKQQQVVYYDGLGRPIQQVAVKSSPYYLDVIVPQVYDGLGRTPTQYLPYTTGGNGAFQPNATSQQNAFYQASNDCIANDPVPSAKTEYENSPLNRILKQGAPGNDWQPTGLGHPISLNQRANHSLDQVRQWMYTSNVFSAPSVYAVGQLMVKETKDEHSYSTLEYSDKNGRAILKKVQSSEDYPEEESDWLSTYYLYDDLGNLRVVIPPAGVQELVDSNTWTLSAAFLQKWCFSYTYDAKQRVVEKQVPGAGTTWLIYNRRDQVVLTRDAKGQMPFIKYDILGRPIMTGFYFPDGSPSCPFNPTRAQLQASADAVSGQWETIIVGSTPGSDTYTLTNSFPTCGISDGVLQTRTFYDTYTFAALGTKSFTPLSLPNFSVTTNDRSSQVQGLVTIQQERTTDDNINWLTTVFYYDNRGRLLQTLTDHYGGGSERTTLQYNFTGQVVQSYLEHSYPTTIYPTAPYESHTIRQRFFYDQAQRLVQTTSQVDAQPEIILANNAYNEIGQLVDKQLHSTDGGDNYLQSVDYRYNIRGWLTNINDRNLSNNGTSFNDADPNSDDPYFHQPDLFGMEIMYNKNLNLAQSRTNWTGDIAEVIWRSRNPSTGTPNTLRGYAYSYDVTHRLTQAKYQTREGAGSNVWSTYTTDYSSSNISYDRNGNLLTMDRKGLGSNASIPAPLDKLHYYYSPTDGNRLIAVDDDVDRLAAPTSPTHDFEDNGQLYAGQGGTGAEEYTYDANGNLLTDNNKGITYMEYSPLNKPTYIEITKGNNYYYILYTYSTTGAKLRKTTYEFVGQNWTMHVTDYVGGFVYEDQVLQFAPTPEGRMIYKPGNGYAWKYEYHIKDHLGNLRFAFRDEGASTKQRSASMEPGNAVEEEETFAHVAETRVQDAQRARTGSYVAKLNAYEGHRQGPSVTIPVAAGDSLRAEAFGRYDHLPTTGRWLRRGAVVAGAVSVPTTNSFPADKVSSSASRRRFSFLGLSVGVIPQLLRPKASSLPTAYLRYELFNRDSQLVATRTLPLHSTPTDSWQRLVTGTTADSAGYARLSLVNESGQPAYFDDISLRLVEPVVFQENHYDPFGLNLVGIEHAGVPNSKFQYNGKEKQEDFGLNWLDYGARMYDSQLGRWTAVDPLASNAYLFSPYVYCGNSPTMFIDPDGRQFTEPAQKRVDAFKQEIADMTAKNNERIAEMQASIGAGGLSDKQLSKLNNKISRFTRQNAGMQEALSEINVLAASNQMYGIKQTQTDIVNGQVVDKPGESGFNFSTGVFEIALPPSGGFGLKSHEMKHAYQFEIGEISIGGYIANESYSNLLYDKSDEVAAYARGALFGQQAYGINDLPIQYSGYPDGPYSIRNVPAISSAIGRRNEDVLLQRVADFTGHAFRVNGKTYYRKQ